MGTLYEEQRFACSTSAALRAAWGWQGVEGMLKQSSSALSQGEGGEMMDMERAGAVRVKKRRSMIGVWKRQYDGM